MSASGRQTSLAHRIVTRVVVAGSLAMAVGLPADLFAGGRDSDGSRMQAREVQCPSNHADSLTPERDRVDWRYIRLQEASRLTIKASFKHSGVGAEVALHSAAGRMIASDTSTDGAATVVHRLESGLYYISVQARDHTVYRLSIR